MAQRQEEQGVQDGVKPMLREPEDHPGGDLCFRRLWIGDCFILEEGM